MNDSFFSVFGFNSSGPTAVLREFVQWLVKMLGPVLDTLRPLWDRLVAFLSQLHEQLTEQYEAEQDRANWGRPELGWAE